MAQIKMVDWYRQSFFYVLLVCNTVDREIDVMYAFMESKN